MSRTGSSRWLIGLALLAITATTLLGRPAGASAFEAPGDLAVIRMVAAEQALLDLTNVDRAANGLPALDFDPETLDIARLRAASQLGPNNLTHYDETGLLAFVRLLQASGLPYGLAGENLARSSNPGEDVIAQIEGALMQSPTHRKNILEQRFNRAAIGAAKDANGRVAFAEIFRGE